MTEHYIVELPDFDFDVQEGWFPPTTRLTLDNGKPHNVAYSTIPIPWSMTKTSCNRMGIPHIDVIHNSVIDEIDLVPVEQLERENVISHLFEVLNSGRHLYHISEWTLPLLKQLNPQSIEDLARFVGLIRPGVRTLFVEKNFKLFIKTECELRDFLEEIDGVIVWQEHILKCLQMLFDLSLEEAESIRSRYKEDLDFPLEMDTMVSDIEYELFRKVYKQINSYLLSKGHCLQVAHIILCQVRMAIQ